MCFCIQNRQTAHLICALELIKPPYQITEKGWGEFEIAIKVFFYDPQEEPVTFIHPLRLYADGMCFDLHCVRNRALMRFVRN